VAERRLDVELTQKELEERLKRWKPPAPRFGHETSVLAKYAKLVGSASEGAVCR